MENTQQIYQKINELAAKLSQDGSAITRADLAYELRDLGVSGDSPEISRYVYEALRHAGNEKLAGCFISNSKTGTLIEEYQIPALIDQGDKESAFDTISKRLNDTSTTLGQLSQLVDEQTKIKLVEAASTLINVVSGTNAIQKIQSEASAIFMKYSEMAGAYTGARDSVQGLTAGFCELRQSTVETYRKYANMLVDIFGDKIKATMPEMFDFGSIKYLDVEGMVKSRQLDYNSIYGKCGDLVGEVSEGFAKALKAGAAQFGAQQDKRVGLVMAGINMLSHYLKTGQRTQSLRQELSELKGSISHDVASIRADEVRLAEIFKTLNDVYIPKAEIFAKAAPTVFDDEFNSLLDTIYTGQAKELRESREALISSIRKLERRINDEQISIDYYSGHVADSKDVLQSLEDQYKKAKTDKPVPPSGLGNVLSLGSAKKNYNRDIYDWTQHCAPLVSKYEDLIVDIKVDSEELEAQQKALAANKIEYMSMIQKLDSINEQLRKSITSTPESKAKVAKHLDDIIKLLHLAKEVSSSKLDDRLANTVEVKRFKDIELPEGLKAAVSSFKEQIVQDMSFTEQDARDFAGSKAKQEQIDEIAAQGKEAISKGIAFCENMARLTAMQANQGLAKEYYDMEFNKIKAEFDANVKDIDNKAQFIQEIARKINTADNPEQLKAALMQLVSADAEGLSPEDLEALLSGSKTISI